MQAQAGSLQMRMTPNPVFGERRVEDSDSGEPGISNAVARTANIIDRLLGRIDPAVTTSYAQWNADETAVEFIQAVPVNDRPRSKEVTLRTSIPAGELATALDVRFPRRIDLRDLADEDDGPPFRVWFLDGQAHLRAQRFGDVVVPGAETVSAVIGALGFTFGFEQRIVYTRASRCVSETPADPAPVETEVPTDEAAPG